MGLSQQTLGHLIGMVESMTHSTLTTNLMRAGVAEDDPKGSFNRADRAAMALNGANERGDVRGLIEFTSIVLNNGRGQQPDGDVAGLVTALRADGWLATSEVVDEPTAWSRGAYRWSVDPLGTTEVPLPPQVDAAVDELKSRGLGVAANHLEQAFSSYAEQRLEASNAQLRPAFEAVLISAAEAHTKWRGTAGGQAIQALQDVKKLEQGEFEFVKGLWLMSHLNGVHPGVSTEAEALFRLTAITATIRFLLSRFL